MHVFKFKIYFLNYKKQNMPTLDRVKNTEKYKEEKKEESDVADSLGRL